MGRKDTEEMSAAQIFYPCMQCADVFFLKADICQLGMDQRKVNMLARYVDIVYQVCVDDFLLCIWMFNTCLCVQLHNLNAELQFY